MVLILVARKGCCSCKRHPIQLIDGTSPHCLSPFVDDFGVDVNAPNSFKVPPLRTSATDRRTTQALIVPACTLPPTLQATPIFFIAIQPDSRFGSHNINYRKMSETFMLLVKKGANVNHRNAWGQSITFWLVRFLLPYPRLTTGHE